MDSAKFTAGEASGKPTQPFWRQLSCYQWVVLAVAWLGWVFDSTNWTPSLIRELLQPQGLAAQAITKMVSYAVMSLNAGAILGYPGIPALR